MLPLKLNPSGKKYKECLLADDFSNHEAT